MREPSWYLRNYEYVEEKLPNGKCKKIEIYTGEYYRPRLEKEYYTLFRISVTGICIAVAALLVTCLANISRGASLPFVGGAAGLSLFPTIYLLIGAFCLLQTPYQMTYREYYRSFRRTRLAAKWMLPFSTLAFLGEAYYLAFRMTRHLAVDWKLELLWLFGMLLVSLLICLLLFLLKRHEMEVSPYRKQE